MKYTIRLSIIVITMLFLTACIRPYQPDVQQGNIINNSDLMQIKYGMNKQEILFILGTPLVIDPFNQSRWDYYYSKKSYRDRETMTRLITVTFDGDNLINLQGDADLSTIASLEPSTEDTQHGGTVITKPTHRAKGFLTRLFNKDPKPAEDDPEPVEDPS